MKRLLKQADIMWAAPHMLVLTAGFGLQPGNATIE